MEGSFQRKIEYLRCIHDRACCVVDVRYGLGMVVENKPVSVRTVRMSDIEALKFRVGRLMHCHPPSYGRFMSSTLTSQPPPSVQEIRIQKLLYLAAQTDTFFLFPPTASSSLTRNCSRNSSTERSQSDQVVGFYCVLRRLSACNCPCDTDP